MKIIRLLWISLFVAAGIGASAQISLSLQLPPTGIYPKKQLWNVLLVSASESPALVRLSFMVTDVSNNQVILTGTSRVFSLSKGARLTQESAIGPVEYNYPSPVVDPGPNGLLPAGKYMICYTLLSATHQTEVPVAEDCASMMIEPLSPPLLNLPADKSLLETHQPQFSWLPPMPAALFTALEYEFRLAEVKDNQSAAEAVQQNLPIYTVSHLKDIFLNYPSSARGLDRTKTYAWQINAFNNGQLIAPSEVWSFTLSPVKKEELPVYSGYTLLRRELDGAVAVCSKGLPIAYIHNSSDTAVRYEIRLLEKKNERVYQGTLTVKPGQNFMDVPLQGFQPEAGKIYLFTLVNARREAWNARFIFSK